MSFKQVLNVCETMIFYKFVTFDHVCGGYYLNVFCLGKF